MQRPSFSLKVCVGLGEYSYKNGTRVIIYLKSINVGRHDPAELTVNTRV